jgi:hypothetical protein
MLRWVITGVVALGTLFALSPGGAFAATPTPTPSALATATAPTGSPTAATGTATSLAETPTALPSDKFPILVFNDLNGDGFQDQGEPGLPGWQITQGCGDIAWILTTDANGFAAGTITVADNCFSIARQFGWLPTRNSVHLRFDPATLNGEPLLYGVHDFGRDVMELHGEAIDAGLPLVQGEPGVAEPYRSCGHLFVEYGSPAIAQAGVIVESAETHAGCPSAGDEIAPSLGYPTPAGPALAFAPGTSANVTWVVDGDSMRFYTFDVTDAWVLDFASGRLVKGCAVTRSVQGGMGPPGFERVFVLSDEVRKGCGAPGRGVRLVRGDTLLDPVLTWQAGNVEQPPEFMVATGHSMTPPNTGEGGPTARGGRMPLALSLALVVIGLALSAAGLQLGRRRSV